MLELKGIPWLAFLTLLAKPASRTDQYHIIRTNSKGVIDEDQQLLTPGLSTQRAGDDRLVSAFRVD
jgi:hypothetical protein